MTFEKLSVGAGGFSSFWGSDLWFQVRIGNDQRCREDLLNSKSLYEIIFYYCLV
jgi:hypothetical protein